jgi:multidrug efflux pump subunit AcrA (membrane-fusion protein)
MIGFGAVSCMGGESAESGSDQSKAPVAEIDSRSVRFFTVLTEAEPERILLSGRLHAESRVELFPEVQGVVTAANKPFKEGILYQKGEVLVRLDDTEARYQLNSSRSAFKKMVSALMADINLDYPDALPQYKDWFTSLHAEKLVQPVPPMDENVIRFLQSKGIFEMYYGIKSAEKRLEKFTIRAPFTGVLSSADAEIGQVVGPQFHLGSLIRPSRFILHASVNPEKAGTLKPGTAVEVMTEDHMQSYTARVSRINPSVNPSSQQVTVYLEVAGEGLREGMYLEGEFELNKANQLAKIPKSSLTRNGRVFVKREGSVKEVSVDVVRLERDMLWVIGLENGAEIVADATEPVGGLITD